MYFNIIGGDLDVFHEPYTVTVTFPIGSTIISSNITIFDDHIITDDGTFVQKSDEIFISITSITNDHIVGTPAVATVTTCKYIRTYILH